MAATTVRRGATVEVERPETVSVPKRDVEQLDETGQVLLRAADIIRKNGWAGAHKWGNPGHPRCVMGAIDEASWRDDGTFYGYARPADRFEASIGFRYGVNWNNEPGRTQEQVVEALERAAIGA